MIRLTTAFAATLVFCAGFTTTIPPALADRPFSVHDLVAIQRISDPQLSPDGERIVFAVKSMDLHANRGRSDLWLVSIDGTGLRRLTSHAEDDINPRWAPDGKRIWFLSNRTGVFQVWRIPVDGGEGEQTTREPLDITSLVLSPNGKHIAFSMDVFPNSGSGAETKKRLDELANRTPSGRVYDRLFIRHWDEWEDGRRSHLFVMPITGGTPTDVMRDMDADCPSKPFGGPQEFTFTPDSRSIVFTARDAGPEEAWSTDFDLYVVPVDGSAKPSCLTEQNQAWDTLPTFSPDGKTLAYLAMARPGYESDRLRIVLMSWPNGPKRVLTKDWDRSPRSLAWSPDVRTIYTTADNIGQHSLFVVDVATGQARTLVREGYVVSPQAVGRRVVFGLHHLRSPVELYSIESDSDEMRAITRLNADKLTNARMGEPEQFSFAGWRNESVYAYVVKPVDFDPSQKYPVAFLIHGGPQGSWSNEFHYRFNPQVYAGSGYTAVMVDFHGSAGYGQAFTDSIRGDWGGKPLEDLKKGLAAALQHYSWMDGDRVAALGESFGGYMINWIAGNWPDRFRCLVNHDGILNTRMFYFDTEELWFPEWDLRGTPWDNPAGYESHNPLNYVKNWRTPMLVIHGALDFRVAETQGFGTFTALQRRGIPSKLLYFPDENHLVLLPANSVLWHETVLDWLGQWTGP